MMIIRRATIVGRYGERLTPVITKGLITGSTSSLEKNEGKDSFVGGRKGEGGNCPER